MNNAYKELQSSLKHLMVDKLIVLFKEGVVFIQKIH
jgi:hypothetical protein